MSMTMLLSPTKPSVEQVRTQVQQGEYEVPETLVAEAILRRLLRTG